MNEHIICYKIINVDPSISNKEQMSFKADVLNILKDPRTWNSFLTDTNEHIPIMLKECNGVSCKGIRSSNGKISIVNYCNIIISLVSNNFIDTKACPGLETDEAYIPLSCTRYDSDTYKVFINYDNWQNGFETAINNERKYYKCDKNEKNCDFQANYTCFKADPSLLVKLYREYVINHEVGHALNRGHFIPKNKSNPAKNKGIPLPIMAQQTKGLYGYNINTWPLPHE
jgi:hypothetical protein